MQPIPRGYPILLVAAGCLVYANSFGGPFIFDDYSCIVENPHIRHLWPIWEVWRSPPEVAIAGRPVVSLTLALNYALGGLRVWGYHAVNLALHLLSALLLYGIIRRTLLRPRLRARFGASAAPLAFVAALLWMVHPLLTESVTYIIQRTELLMAACLLLTMWCVIRDATDGPARRWDIAAVLACAVGMGSKEVMVVTPLLVWVYDAIFLSTTWHAPLRKRRGLYLGLASTWLILAGLLATHPRTMTAGFTAHGITPWHYALTQSTVIWHYVRLAAWPAPLIVDYSDWPIVRDLASVGLPVTALAGLIAATAWALRRRPALGFLGAWWFMILAPTSSLLPIATEVAAERRMYLPLAALVTLVVIGGWRFLRACIHHAGARRAVAAIVIAGSVAILGACTVRRNHVYRNEEALLRQLIAVRPNNAHAYYNLGITLGEQGRFDESVAAFHDALRLVPRDAGSHNNLGAVLLQQGNIDEAIGEFQEAIRLRPDLGQPRLNLERALAVQQGHAAARPSRPTDPVLRRQGIRSR